MTFSNLRAVSIRLALGIAAGGGFGIWLGTAAHAADLDANSRITAVTVFTRAAEVTRAAKLPVPAGEHTVILRDLPLHLLADSIRVEGEADGTLEIGSVDTATVLLPEDASATEERKRIEKEIERLNDAQAELNDTIAAAEARKTLAQNLTKLPSQPGPRDQTQGARSPADWAGIATLIGEQIAAADKIIRDARIENRKIQRDIEDLQRKLASIPPRRVQRTEVRINVNADAELTADLNIRYQVTNASWSPVYEARLSSGTAEKKSGLALARRARVSQRTGEAWKDVALTLSTVQPRQGTAAPRVRTLRVEFQPKIRTISSTDQSSFETMQESLQSTPAPSMAPQPEGRMAKPAAKLRRVAKKQARVVNAPFQASYVISGRHTIPTDGVVRRVEVDRLDFEPKLILRTVPRKRAVAYLYTDVKIGENIRILPGPVSLFRDGTFVGRGALPTLAAGETHELGFGQDDTVKVEHVTLTEKTGESGIISTSKTDTRQFRTTITNGHQRPIAIRVLDQLPVSGDEDIEVVLTSGATPPTKRDVDDKKGVLAWDFTLKPKAEKIINFGYRISWPEDRRIRFRETGR